MRLFTYTGTVQSTLPTSNLPCHRQYFAPKDKPRLPNNTSTANIPYTIYKGWGTLRGGKCADRRKAFFLLYKRVYINKCLLSSNAAAPLFDKSNLQSPPPTTPI